MGLSSSAGRKGESVGSQALVQLSPKQPKQSPLEQGRSVRQGEKPVVVNWETTSVQKRAEPNAALKLRSAGMLAKPAAEGKLRPRPGDLIEIFRIGYEHWAIYMEDDWVVHLAPPSDGFEAGSVTSIFSNKAVVRRSRLEDVLHGCSWKINNKLDGTYTPLPMDKVIHRAKHMINKVVQYSLIEGNCEHFVNDLRYGVSRSQQLSEKRDLSLDNLDKVAWHQEHRDGSLPWSTVQPLANRATSARRGILPTRETVKCLSWHIYMEVVIYTETIQFLCCQRDFGHPEESPRSAACLQESTAMTPEQQCSGRWDASRGNGHNLQVEV